MKTCLPSHDMRPSLSRRPSLSTRRRARLVDAHGSIPRCHLEALERPRVGSRRVREGGRWRFLSERLVRSLVVVLAAKRVEGALLTSQISPWWSRGLASSVRWKRSWRPVVRANRSGQPELPKRRVEDARHLAAIGIQRAPAANQEARARIDDGQRVAAPSVAGREVSVEVHAPGRVRTRHVGKGLTCSLLAPRLP